MKLLLTCLVMSLTAQAETKDQLIARLLRADPIAQMLILDDPKLASQRETLLREIKIREDQEEKRRLNEILGRIHDEANREEIERGIKLLAAPQPLQPAPQESCDAIQDVMSLVLSKSAKFETPESCKTPEKNLYHNALKKSLGDPSYAAVAEAEVPVDCVASVMKAFQVPSRNFVACEMDPAKCPGKCSPVRGFQRPCVTKEYAYHIYNNFVDVMSCLGLSQKELLPKLLNESGMHVNVQGPQSDIGIGQITPIALKDSNQNWNRFLKETKADKPSCARISANLAKMGPTESVDDCNLISPPQSPLKNLFYVGIVARRNQEIVKAFLKDPDIDEMEKNTHLPNFRPALVKMLSTLGYNAGAGTAAIMYNRYLVGLKKSKLNLNDDAQLKKLFSFAAPLKNPKTEGVACADVGIKVQMWELSFPDYVKLCQPAGAKGYANRVYEKKIALDNLVAGGVCTEKKYLEF